MKKVSLILVALLMAAGCGTNMFKGMEDKNTTEASASEVIMKLDSGDYDWVLANPDKANATDYAAAAMGAAGLDPTELVNALNNIAESTSVKKNDLGAVASISIDTTALGALQTAKEKLTEELIANPGDPDLSFQMVLTSITSTITAIAKAGEEGSITNFAPSDGINSTEAADLGNYIAANPNKLIDANEDGISESLITLIATDVGNAVDALPNADLGSSELNNVLRDVTQGQGSLDYDGDDTVESTDISAYFINVLGQ